MRNISPRIHLRVTAVAIVLVGGLALPTLASSQNTAIAHGAGMQPGAGTTGCNFYVEASRGMPQQSAEGAGVCAQSGTIAGKPVATTVTTSVSATKTGILQASVSTNASNIWVDGTATAGYNDWITITLNEGATYPSEILLTAILQGTHTNTASGHGFARMDTRVGGMFFEMISMAPLGYSGTTLLTETYRIPITAPDVFRSGSTLTFGLDMRMLVSSAVAMVFNDIPQGSSSTDFSAGSGAQRIWLVDASGNELAGQYSMAAYSERAYDPSIVPPITATPEPLTLGLTASGLLLLLGVQRGRRRSGAAG